MNDAEHRAWIRDARRQRDGRDPGFNDHCTAIPHQTPNRYRDMNPDDREEEILSATDRLLRNEARIERLERKFELLLQIGDIRLLAEFLSDRPDRTH